MENRYELNKQLAQTVSYTHLDPVNGWFTILLGNRCHNRVTTVIPSPGKTRADYGVSSSGVVTSIITPPLSI